MSPRALAGLAACMQQMQHSPRSGLPHHLLPLGLSGFCQGVSLQLPDCTCVVQADAALQTLDRHRSGNSTVAQHGTAAAAAVTHLHHHEAFALGGGLLVVACLCTRMLLNGQAGGGASPAALPGFQCRPSLSAWRGEQPKHSMHRSWQETVCLWQGNNAVSASVRHVTVCLMVWARKGASLSHRLYG